MAKTSGYPREAEIRDRREMIVADAQHLANALATGHRRQAHQFVNAITNNTQRLEDLEAGRA